MESAPLALVTGSRRNIGLAIARRLSAEGYSIAVHGRVIEPPKFVTDEIAARGDASSIQYYSVDLASPSGADELIRQVEDRQGTIDCLVNNVALRPHTALLDIDRSEWESVIHLGLYVPFRLAQKVLPSMIDRRDGIIVNIGGVDGFKGKPHRAHGVATKAGLHGLTMAIAAEYGQVGVKAVTVSPGTVDTAKPPDRYPNFNQKAHEAATLLNRLVQREEIADAVYFASEVAALTGQVLHVNAGTHLG